MAGAQSKAVIVTGHSHGITLHDNKRFNQPKKHLAFTWSVLRQPQTHLVFMYRYLVLMQLVVSTCAWL
jgi:hypothetical protein